MIMRTLIQGNYKYISALAPIPIGLGGIEITVYAE